MEVRDETVLTFTQAIKDPGAGLKVGNGLLVSMPWPKLCSLFNYNHPPHFTLFLPLRTSKISHVCPGISLLMVEKHCLLSSHLASYFAFLHVLSHPSFPSPVGLSLLASESLFPTIPIACYFLSLCLYYFP